jgi:hypothetical protein
MTLRSLEDYSPLLGEERHAERGIPTTNSRGGDISAVLGEGRHCWRSNVSGRCRAVVGCVVG